MSVKEDKSYKYCLNCGEELQGKYCHKCGQKRIGKVPSIKDFIKEYVDISFVFDSKLLPTLKHLLRKPGFLTNEYIKGRYVSYENPLKLNSFFLVTFITLMVVFADTTKIENSLEKLFSDNKLSPELTLSVVSEKSDYMAKVAQSDRDTVDIYAYEQVFKHFANILKPIEDIDLESVTDDYDSDDIELEVWRADIPSVLIVDNILVADNEGIYNFNFNASVLDANSSLSIIFAVWETLLHIIFGYFPLILLLTTPFLAIAIGFVFRKYKMPHVHYFVFALHYTAFIEFLILVLYLISQIISLPYEVMKWIIIIVSNTYLTLAIKSVFGSQSWFKAVLKALIIGFNYLLICICALIIIFLIAVFTVSVSA